LPVEVLAWRLGRFFANKAAAGGFPGDAAAGDLEVMAGHDSLGEGRAVELIAGYDFLGIRNKLDLGEEEARKRKEEEYPHRKLFSEYSERHRVMDSPVGVSV
jgi:hypothetical protein